MTQINRQFKLCAEGWRLVDAWNALCEDKKSSRADQRKAYNNLIDHRQACEICTKPPRKPNAGDRCATCGHDWVSHGAGFNPKSTSCNAETIKDWEWCDCKEFVLAKPPEGAKP